MKERNVSIDLENGFLTEEQIKAALDNLDQIIAQMIEFRDACKKDGRVHDHCISTMLPVDAEKMRVAPEGEQIQYCAQGSATCSPQMMMETTKALWNRLPNDMKMLMMLDDMKNFNFRKEEIKNEVPAQSDSVN